MLFPEALKLQSHNLLFQNLLQRFQFAQRFQFSKKHTRQIGFVELIIPNHQFWGSTLVFGGVLLGYNLLRCQAESDRN